MPAPSPNFLPDEPTPLGQSWLQSTRKIPRLEFVLGICAATTNNPLKKRGHDIQNSSRRQATTVDSLSRQNNHLSQMSVRRPQTYDKRGRDDDVAGEKSGNDILIPIAPVPVMPRIPREEEETEEERMRKRQKTHKPPMIAAREPDLDDLGNFRKIQPIQAHQVQQVQLQQQLAQSSHHHPQTHMHHPSLHSLHSVHNQHNQHAHSQHPHASHTTHATHTTHTTHANHPQHAQHPQHPHTAHSQLPQHNHTQHGHAHGHAQHTQHSQHTQHGQHGHTQHTQPHQMHQHPMQHIPHPVKGLMMPGNLIANSQAAAHGITQVPVPSMQRGKSVVQPGPPGQGGQGRGSTTVVVPSTTVVVRGSAGGPTPAGNPPPSPAQNAPSPVAPPTNNGPSVGAAALPTVTASNAAGVPPNSQAALGSRIDGWVRHPTGPERSGKYTAEEDDIIRKAVIDFCSRHGLNYSEAVAKLVATGDGDRKDLRMAWVEISACLPTRTTTSVYYRARRILDSNVNKGIWTKEEEQMLRSLVEQYGKKWHIIGKKLNRLEVAVRDKWRTMCKEKQGRWMPSDVDRLIKMRENNMSWVTIAEQLKRSEDQVKKKWKNLEKRNTSHNEDHLLIRSIIDLKPQLEKDIDWDGVVTSLRKSGIERQRAQLETRWRALCRWVCPQEQMNAIDFQSKLDRLKSAWLDSHIPPVLPPS